MPCALLLCSLMLAPRGPVAIFEEPSFPAEWASVAPSELRAMLERLGYEVTSLDARQVGDPELLAQPSAPLLIHPYGARFPVEAWPALRGWLQAGGKLLTLGGYAFREPVERTADGWTDHNARVARERTPEALLAHSVLPRATELPLPTGSATTRVAAAEGELPERLVVTTPPGGGGIALPLDLEPDRDYALSFRARGIDVTAPGFGFIAIYELAADGSILQWFDATQLRDATDWRTVVHPFRTHPSAARRELRLGSFLGHGTWELAEIALAPWAEKVLMTTADGVPRDGLVTKPEQLGVFDADCPLRRARSVAWAAPGEPEVGPEGELRGWSAVGLTGGSTARWIPLLQARDRYGRPAGPCFSLLAHYGGHYANAMIAYCGLEGDLRAALGEPLLERSLATAVSMLMRGVFLEAPRCAPDVVLPGEAPSLSVRVRNASAAERTVALRVEAEGAEATERSVTVAPRSFTEVAIALPSATEPGLHRLRASLSDADGAFDRADSGWVVAEAGGSAGGPRVQWRDNGFLVDGQPRVLFGSDAGTNVVWSPAEGPRGWAEDFALCRDFGLDVYENLQYAWRPGGFPEPEMRSIDGLTRLAGDAGRIYMAGWLIGADTWIPPAEHADQEAFLERVGARYRDASWMIHYINGDLRADLQPEDTMAERFREWSGDPSASFAPTWSGAWSEARLRKAAEFGIGETREWVTAHTEALRRGGATQPVTCEYYQLPLAGVDLPETVDALDSANIGFFGHVPGEDLRDLARALCFEDSRIRGKGLALGEFGVKTHPAWGSDLDPSSYHTRRGHEEQRRLFVGLVHLGLGMGVSKFQNWCLRDFDEYCFPWGLFEPNAKQPKPVAWTYRSLTMLGHHVTPRVTSPEVVVLLPDFHRLGGGGERAYQAALSTFDALLAAHVPFQTLPDTRLAELPPSARVLWWPIPFACSDEARERVERFVREGGRLYLSGDLSWTDAREHTRLAEFERLIGARVVEPAADPDGLALLAAKESDLGPLTRASRLEPTSSEVLARFADGEPLLLRHALGEGEVVFANAAAELFLRAPGLARLYERSLRALEAPRTACSDPRVVVFEGPTHEGGSYLQALNLGDEAVSVTLGSEGLRADLPAGAPLLVARDASGRWSAISVVGRVALSEGVSLEAPVGAACLRAPGEGFVAVVAPYGAGPVTLADAELSGARWELGETRSGAWRPYESLDGPFSGSAWLEFDADRATLIGLLAPEADLPRARALCAR